MRTQSGWGLVLFLATTAAGCGNPRAAQPPSGDSFLRDYAQTRGFSLGRPIKAQFTPDGQAVLFLRAQPRAPKLCLYEFALASRQTRALLTPEQVLGTATETLSPAERARRERMRVTTTGFTDFQLSEDGRLILLSLSGKLYVVERASGQVSELKTGPGQVLDPKFSPDGKSVAYVRDYDVHVFELEKQKERQVTRGGSEELSHGLAEFVAQEEMDRFTGYWWSPDAKFIAFEEADARRVEVWRVNDPSKPEETGPRTFYPRPGKENVRVRLGVAPVRGRKVVWVRWDADQYPYLARVEWNKHGGLTLSVQSRDQRELAVLRADPRTGQTAPLVSERDAAWVNLDQDVPRWVANGNSFLWTSEREGSKQLELRAADGQLLRVLAPPELGCQSLVSVDERGGLVYFCASPDPTQSHLHRVSLNGGEAVAMTRRPGLHGAVFARDFSVYVHSVSTPEATPVSAVRRLDGSVIGELPSVAEPPPFLPKFQLLKVGEGGGFYARVIRPSDFAAQRKYPVLMNVYGGPRANVVQAALSGQFLNQWLADRGFIVVSLDGRGTPGRGREWERAIFKGFGRVPLEDQVAGLAALGRQFPELDLEQVGVFGWSFGGYLSAQAVLRRPDVFKVAVAGAPVTDWLDYDTHYTERYLGFPEVHPEAYRESSLLTYAADLRRPLLLIHGTVDDNVYFRHSLKLADALFRAGRDFEMLPLAGFTHMVPDPVVTERLWSRIAAYFQQHLGAPSR